MGLTVVYTGVDLVCYLLMMILGFWKMLELSSSVVGSFAEWLIRKIESRAWRKARKESLIKWQPPQHFNCRSVLIDMEESKDENT